EEHPIESQGDEGTQEEDEEMALDLIEHEDVTVHEVSLALQRIAGGTFGRCVTCGQWIDHGRLQVVPYARHCIGCEQSSREPGPSAEDVTPVR
ncbi:MAG: TraR/DksA family transcriptional regulator, partial [Planctomycetota bacterium]